MEESYERGYIFFNHTYNEFCIQEIGMEPNDREYKHSIRPFEVIEVNRNGVWERITGINKMSESPDQLMDLVGLEIRYKKI